MADDTTTSTNDPLQDANAQQKSHDSNRTGSPTTVMIQPSQVTKLLAFVEKKEQEEQEESGWCSKIKAAVYWSFLIFAVVAVAALIIFAVAEHGAGHRFCGSQPGFSLWNIWI